MTFLSHVAKGLDARIAALELDLHVLHTRKTLFFLAWRDNALLAPATEMNSLGREEIRINTQLADYKHRRAQINIPIAIEFGDEVHHLIRSVFPITMDTITQEVSREQLHSGYPLVKPVELQIYTPDMVIEPSVSRREVIYVEFRWHEIVSNKRRVLVFHYNDQGYDILFFHRLGESA